MAGAAACGDDGEDTSIDEPSEAAGKGSTPAGSPAAGSPAAGSPAAGSGGSGGSESSGPKNIVQTAVAAGSFKHIVEVDHRNVALNA